MAFADEIELESSSHSPGHPGPSLRYGRWGTARLTVERFKHYVLQDYVYLIDYSRVLAMACGSGPGPGYYGLVCPPAGRDPQR